MVARRRRVDRPGGICRGGLCHLEAGHRRCIYLPSIAESSMVLEVAVGHGRWTPFLARRAQRYIGVDFSLSCIDFCRKRFAHLTNVDFHNTDGCTLSFLLSDSVQFIWSYDSFVHMEPDITECYLAEFARILSP